MHDLFFKPYSQIASYLYINGTFFYPSSVINADLYDYNVADSKVLVSIPGCILSCSLRAHPTLAKASHLIPPKVVISYDDIIPGLLPTNVPEGTCMYLNTSLVLMISIKIFTSIIYMMH